MKRKRLIVMQQRDYDSCGGLLDLHSWVRRDNTPVSGGV